MIFNVISNFIWYKYFTIWISDSGS